MPTLEFKGKSHIYAHHLTVPYRPLQLDLDRSILPDTQEDSIPLTDQNLVIHGDNLHALKALLPQYAGRVKCIYIDPPYNTGNEGWVYNDNVNNPLMQDWFEKNSPVDGEDLERHEKWLCMMWPRLHLLRELLSEDGAIFISIDDNEVHHLRMLMDEIFGEQNFRNLIVVRRGVKNVQAQFDYVDRLNTGSEFMMFYSKSPEKKFKHLTVERDSRRAGTWNNHWRGTNRPTMRYELMGIIPERGQWRWSEVRSMTAIVNYERLIDECGDDVDQESIDEWWFAQSPETPDLLRLSTSGRPEHYVPPSDRRILSSLWTDFTVNESPAMKKILNIDLENPKRTSLVERVIEYLAGPNDIILDSFAGSGTSAHAVLSLNKTDGANRRFVLVECEDYADLGTADRVRRVIQGVSTAKDKTLKEGLGGSFIYCTLGDPIDIDSLLTGDDLPAFTDLASYLLHTATGISASPGDLHASNADGRFYSSDNRDYYLIYEPSIEFLRGGDSALNLERAERIREKGRPAVVFAAAKYISQNLLSEWQITFCQLPYELGFGG